jgi:ABC-type dipeptide/oligopeptide/nickel transport system ATPase component
MSDLLLDATLSVDYPGKPGVLRDFRLRMEPGEIYALAGQSGSGKSTFAMAVLGLLDGKRAKVRGEIWFEGANLLLRREAEMRRIRGARISLVPQSPLAALNPCMRLGSHLRESWLAHQPGRRTDWKQEALRALRMAQLPGEDAFLDRFPRELSVGMAQRFLIALAILHRPRLLIADEATSALDLITQAEILDLFRYLNRDHDVTLLLITHDLASAASCCHRIGILHQGAIVEEGSIQAVFQNPSHPYSRRLIASLPAFPDTLSVRPLSPTVCPVDGILTAEEKLS